MDQGSHRQTRPVLRVLRMTVRGGLSNQKECLVNAAIVAHFLNVSLLLPNFDLNGRGNERFEPTGAKYVKPYAERDKWGHFSHLFNVSRFVSGLTGRLAQPLIHRIRDVTGPGDRPHVVRLTADYLRTRCGAEGRDREVQQGTCEARRGDTSLLTGLVEEWRPVIRSSFGLQFAARSSSSTKAVVSDRGVAGGAPAEGAVTKSRPLQAAQALPTTMSDGRPVVIFDAGQSLCWNAYKSRHAHRCGQQFPVCQHILHSLQWNRVISRMQQRVLRGMARLVAQNSTSSESGKALHPWTAVHVRAFVCARNGRGPKFEHVLSALHSRGIFGGVLYLVSSIPLAEVQRALQPSFTVVAKSTFLGERIQLEYPFEVLAAVDYGVAAAAPLYLGEAKLSSFDAFASEERRRLGKPDVAEIASTCGD